MSADGKRIYCGSPLQVIDTETNAAVSTSINGGISDVAITPDDRQILISSFSGMIGTLNIFDATTFAKIAQISDLGDYAGDITFSADGGVAAVGSAGNPHEGGGRVSAEHSRPTDCFHRRLCRSPTILPPRGTTVLCFSRQG